MRRPSSTAITPAEIITSPMVTQADTLQRIVTVKYMSTPVPIYLFKQPARLSHLELPFKIVLLQGKHRPPHIRLEGRGGTWRDVEGCGGMWRDVKRVGVWSYAEGVGVCIWVPAKYGKLSTQRAE